jgi:tetratricopeptide (TPR) repeat protein
MSTRTDRPEELTVPDQPESDEHDANGLHAIHLALAESGRNAALRHEHTEALRSYREAIKLAVAAKAPEVFFRYYTQCVLESLERTGSYDEVIAFCEEADAHHQSVNSTLPIHRKDHGSLLERLGIVLLKDGRRDDGREALERAVETAGPRSLPIAEEILGWLARGYEVSAPRLTQLQERSGYFIVRRDDRLAERAELLRTGIDNLSGDSPRESEEG